MCSNERSDQISGGIFFIGLALLFITGAWWPGIMLVIGASTIARGMAEGRHWYSATGGVWMVGLGLLFWFGFRWELLLIVAGLSMLLGFSKNTYGDEDDEQREKRKNDHKLKNDDYEMEIV